MGGGETGEGVIVLSPPSPPVKESTVRLLLFRAWKGFGVDLSMLRGSCGGLWFVVLFLTS